MDQEILKSMAVKQTKELEQILAENNKNIYKDETFDVIRYLLDKRRGEYSPEDNKDHPDSNIKVDKPEIKGNIMFCTNCGNEVQESAIACPKCGLSPRTEKKYCYNCGIEVNEKQVMCVKCGVSLKNVKYSDPNTSEKSRLITFLLCFFLGTFGAHRFYVGKITSGIMQILFGWATLFIWPLVDLIMILAGNFKDIENKVVKNWEID